jgi:hypothetical protein
MFKQLITACSAAVVALFGGNSRKPAENPEDMLRRGFEQSYPGWVKDGLLKKPE